MMAEIPGNLQMPAPPFSQLGIDLFGPMEVTDDVQEKNTRYVRAYKKMWGMVVVCLGTHAVKLYLVQGYSTEDFLLAWIANHRTMGCC